jgi:hypothetical protein
MEIPMVEEGEVKVGVQRGARQVLDFSFLPLRQIELGNTLPPKKKFFVFPFLILF